MCDFKNRVSFLDDLQEIDPLFEATGQHCWDFDKNITELEQVADLIISGTVEQLYKSTGIVLQCYIFSRTTNVLKIYLTPTLFILEDFQNTLSIIHCRYRSQEHLFGQSENSTHFQRTFHHSGPTNAPISTIDNCRELFRLEHLSQRSSSRRYAYFHAQSCWRHFQVELQLDQDQSTQLGFDDGYCTW